MMKKLLKISTTVLLIMSLVLSLSGCDSKIKAEETVSKLFSAFKALDFVEAQKYIDMGQINIPEFDENILGDQSAYMEALFDKLDCRIVSSKRTGINTVDVVADITAVDMGPLFEEIITDAMQMTFSGTITDPNSMLNVGKRVEELFLQAAENPDLNTVTNRITIKVEKKNGIWKVAVDDTFVNAIFGDLIKATKDLANPFK